MNEKQQEAWDEVMNEIEDITSKLEAIRSAVECAGSAETIGDVVANLDEAEGEVVALASDLRSALRAARQIKGAR